MSGWRHRNQDITCLPISMEIIFSQPITHQINSSAIKSQTRGAHRQTRAARLYSVYIKKHLIQNRQASVAVSRT